MELWQALFPTSSGGLELVRMAGKIAKWGWLIVPFPYDIVTGMVSFFISIMVFIGLPIIPIRKAYKEQMLDAEVVE